jgi:hypothetical protein
MHPHFVQSDPALTEEDLLERLRTAGLTEIDATNVELKRSWDQRHGKKISAFVNRLSSRNPAVHRDDPSRHCDDGQYDFGVEVIQHLCPPLRRKLAAATATMTRFVAC